MKRARRDKPQMLKVQKVYERFGPGYVDPRDPSLAPTILPNYRLRTGRSRTHGPFSMVDAPAWIQELLYNQSQVLCKEQIHVGYFHGLLQSPDTLIWLLTTVDDLRPMAFAMCTSRIARSPDADPIAAEDAPEEERNDLVLHLDLVCGQGGAKLVQMCMEYALNAKTKDGDPPYGFFELEAVNPTVLGIYSKILKAVFGPAAEWRLGLMSTGNTLDEFATNPYATNAFQVARGSPSGDVVAAEKRWLARKKLQSDVYDKRNLAYMTRERYDREPDDTPNKQVYLANRDAASAAAAAAEAALDALDADAAADAISAAYDHTGLIPVHFDISQVRDPDYVPEMMPIDEGALDEHVAALHDATMAQEAAALGPVDDMMGQTRSETDERAAGALGAVLGPEQSAVPPPAEDALAAEPSAAESPRYVKGLPTLPLSSLTRLLDRARRITGL